jgi:amidase
VRRIAHGLGITSLEDTDAKDYLLLLKSFEGIMQNIDQGSDYLHPDLIPQPTVESREFWKARAEDNPLNAWSHRCCLQSAKPANGILKGRTVAIKDNISVGGLPTTVGTSKDILSKSAKLPVSPIDATVVSRILASGAVVKGTSTCENFCASPLSFSSATGPVHHPLLHGYTTGGSSSGSAALVAAHVIEQKHGEKFGVTAELAIGSDQAGSVRIPAAYTGIYGLKPTFGLIPYTGAVSMSPMIDHLGPLATNLEDIAALLKVMAGYDGLDARMTPESPLLNQVKNYPALLAEYRESRQQYGMGTTPPGIKKIGLLKESFAVEGLSPEVCDGIYHATRTYFAAAGAEVVEISVPMHSEGPIIWTAATRASISDWLCQGKPSGYLSYLPPHVQTQWPPTQEMYELLTSTNPAVINIILSGKLAEEQFGGSLEAKAHRKVFELRAAYDSALDKVDVLIAPCAPTVAQPNPKMMDEHGSRTTIMEKLRTIVGVTNNTCSFNVSGHPALSVPVGSLPAVGHPEVLLPYGMQIIGKRWHDEKVLMAAALFERGRSLTKS